MRAKSDNKKAPAPVRRTRQSLVSRKAQRRITDSEEIQQGIAKNIPFLVTQLFPAAKRQGNTVRIGSVNGEAGASLAVDATTGLWIDHATGQSGDFIDLWQAARGIGFKQALEEIRANGGGIQVHTKKAPESAENCLKRQSWESILYQPSESHIMKISELLQIGPEGLKLAAARGHLWLRGDHFVITDSARYARADRRIDGQKLRTKAGDEVKTRTLGSAKWPIGSYELRGYDYCLLTEGVSDFLAAHHLLICEEVQSVFGVVGILGARNRIHPQAIECFTGKSVLIVPDCDRPGIEGAETWKDQLKHVAKTVLMFDLTRFKIQSEIIDGSRGVGDLRDFLQVDYQQWEDGARFLLSRFMERTSNGN